MTTTEDSPIDAIDLSSGIHHLATGLIRIAEAYAVEILPFVLANTLKLTRGEKAKAVAKLKAMMPAATFDAILADHTRR